MAALSSVFILDVTHESFPSSTLRKITPKVLGLAAWTQEKVHFVIVIMNRSRPPLRFSYFGFAHAWAGTVLTTPCWWQHFLPCVFSRRADWNPKPSHELWILPLTLKQRWPWLTLSVSASHPGSIRINQRSSPVRCNRLILTDKGCSKATFLLSVKIFILIFFWNLLGVILGLIDE